MSRVSRILSYQSYRRLVGRLSQRSLVLMTPAGHWLRLLYTRNDNFMLNWSKPKTYSFLMWNFGDENGMLPIVALLLNEGSTRLNIIQFLRTCSVFPWPVAMFWQRVADVAIMCCPRVQQGSNTTGILSPPVTELHAYAEWKKTGTSSWMRRCFHEGCVRLTMLAKICKIKLNWSWKEIE